MHGAITAELARIGFDENPRSLSEPDYGKFGKEMEPCAVLRIYIQLQRRQKINS
jgi:hypothetical protein